MKIKEMVPHNQRPVLVLQSSSRFFMCVLNLAEVWVIREPPPSMSVGRAEYATDLLGGYMKKKYLYYDMSAYLK